MGQESFVEISTEQYLKELIAIESSFPESTDYFIISSSKVFVNYEASIPIQETRMQVKCKAGKIYNVQTNDLLVIQEGLIAITIDSANNQIYLSSSDIDFNYKKQPGDLMNLGEIAKKIHKKTTKNSTIYSIEFNPGYILAALEFTMINDKIESVTHYSNQSYDYYTYPNDLAKFEMKIKEFKIGNNSVKENTLLRLTDVVVITETEVSLTEKFKTFELIDLR